MICPKCQGEQHCPCQSCADKNHGKVTWIWVTGNGPIKCGHCGHTMSCGEWEAEEFKQFDAWEKSQAAKEAVMSDQISDRINQKQFEVMAATGKAPKSVYLGEKEIKELFAWAKEFFDLETEPKIESGPEFLGMKVYEVKQESHFNVA